MGMNTKDLRKERFCMNKKQITTAFKCLLAFGLWVVMAHNYFLIYRRSVLRYLKRTIPRPPADGIMRELLLETSLASFKGMSLDHPDPVDPDYKIPIIPNLPESVNTILQGINIGESDPVDVHKSHATITGSIYRSDKEYDLEELKEELSQGDGTFYFHIYENMSFEYLTPDERQEARGQLFATITYEFDDDFILHKAYFQPWWDLRGDDQVFLQQVTDVMGKPDYIIGSPSPGGSIEYVYSSKGITILSSGKPDSPIYSIVFYRPMDYAEYADTYTNMTPHWRNRRDERVWRYTGETIYDYSEFDKDPNLNIADYIAVGPLWFYFPMKFKIFYWVTLGLLTTGIVLLSIKFFRTH